jgi:ABC-type glutathione transport system ATPase component
MLTEPKSRLADFRIVRVERCSQEGDTGQILAINLGLQSGRGSEGTNPAAGRRDENENRSMSEPALAMRQVSKTHGLGPQRVNALVAVDLIVMPGELVAVTGRSGCQTSMT